jgi:hypothetical protein
MTMNDNSKIALFLVVVAVAIMVQQFFGYASHSFFEIRDVHHESFVIATIFAAVMVCLFGRKKL